MITLAKTFQRLCLASATWTARHGQIWDYKNLIGMLAMSTAAIPYPVLPSLEVGASNYYRFARDQGDLDRLNRLYEEVIAMTPGVPALIKTNVFFRAYEEVYHQDRFPVDEEELGKLGEKLDTVHLAHNAWSSDLHRTMIEDGHVYEPLSQRFEPLLSTVPDNWGQRLRLGRALNRLPFIYHPAMVGDPEWQPLRQDAFCDTYSFTLACGKHDLVTTSNREAVATLTALLQLESQEARDMLEETGFCKDSMVNWWGDQGGAIAQSQGELKKEKEQEEEGKGNEKKEGFAYSSSSSIYYSGSKAFGGAASEVLRGDLDRLDGLYEETRRLYGYGIPDLLKMNEFFRAYEQVHRQDQFSVGKEEARALQKKFNKVNEEYRLHSAGEIDDRTGNKDGFVRFAGGYKRLLSTMPNNWGQRRRVRRALVWLPFIYHPIIVKDPELQPLRQLAFCDIYSFTLACGKHDLVTTSNREAVARLIDLLRLESQEARDMLEETGFCKDSMVNWWGDQSGAEAQSRGEKWKLGTEGRPISSFLTFPGLYD